jgi:hypothetical protein
MRKLLVLLTLGGMLCASTTLMAQVVEFRGLKNNMRYDTDEEYYQYNYYVGWDAEQGKAIFKTDQGVFSLKQTGPNQLSNPELLYDDNLMYGNSGALYYDGTIYTVFSHENEITGEPEFIVRSWDAETGTKLSERVFPGDSNLESRGMTYNPKDGKVYGLFHFTNVPIDFDEYDENSTDAGYCLCTIDLSTMTLTPITHGLYYDNFVTLAASPDGRLFAMTSGGTLTEFDPQTGLMMGTFVTDSEGNRVFINKYGHSGVVSQFHRQAACFDKNTGKMYWNGYVNNGMGYNEWGSYGPLPDRNWKENEKYDTALYEVDINTGKATLISKIHNRITFSCMWVVGGDNSEDAISTIKGDANGDHVVDITDVMTIVNYLLDYVPSNFLFANADMNENGSVNIADLMDVVNLLLLSSEQ